MRVFTKIRNEGVAKAYKTGIDLARNKYIIFLDDDDLLPKNSLKLRAEFALDNHLIDWFYGKAKWVNEEGKPVKIAYHSKFYENFRYERLLIRNYIHGGTPTIKREVIIKIKWPTWIYRSQDYFLWLELMRPERKLKVGFINESLYTYRIHAKRYTRSLINKKAKKSYIDNINRIKNELHPENLVFLAGYLDETIREKSLLKKKIKSHE
jgi:glycosyltransferase involved in cell wall biosynthesis